MLNKPSKTVGKQEKIFDLIHYILQLVSHSSSKSNHTHSVLTMLGWTDCEWIAHNKMCGCSHEYIYSLICRMSDHDG